MEFGNKLAHSGHFAATEILNDVAELQELWSDVEQEWSRRKQLVTQCYELQVNVRRILRSTMGTLSNKNGDGVRQTYFGFVFRKKLRIISVRVNCVHNLSELFEASKYLKNLPLVAQR